MQPRPRSMRRRVTALALITLSAVVGASVTRPPRAAAAPVPGVEPGLALRHAGGFGRSETAYRETPNQLNLPVAVEATDDGVWVAEGRGKRLLRFESAGRLADQWGRAGFAYPVGQAPKIGFIADVATSDSGNLVFADATGGYVGAFDASGAFTLLRGRPGAPGSGPGELLHPSGVAFDSRGNVFISDGPPPEPGEGIAAGNHRVLAVAPDGTLLATIGTTGTPGRGLDQFERPGKLAVDHTYRLYVADTGNHRVQVFDVSDPSAPRYESTLGSGAAGDGPEEFDGPVGVAVDRTFVYVADTGNCRVQLLARNTGRHFATLGGICGDTADRFASPLDVAVDSGGNIYVADAGNSRVQQFSPRREFARSFGTAGIPYIADTRHHNLPAGVAHHPDGGVVVAEAAGHRVVKRDAFGIVEWTYGSAGKAGDGPGQLRRPRDVAVADDGRALISDAGNARLVELLADGTLSIDIPLTGVVPCPEGVAWSPDGRIYVAAPCRHAVAVLDAAGAVQAWLGTPDAPGDLAGNLRAPEGVALAADGRVWVADTGNNRVVGYTAGGDVAAIVGSGGAGRSHDSLSEPARVAVGPDGYLYVTDRGNSRLQVLAPDGRYVTTAGGRWGAGQGALREPLGVSVAASGELLVADSENHRVQRFARGVPYWRADSLNGFSDYLNLGVASLAAYGEALYAGTVNEGETGVEPGGAEIWRLSGGAWERIVDDGLAEPANTAVVAMEEFGGGLYAGTRNGDGAELWRSGTGDAWSRVIGVGLEGAGEVAVLAELDGQLYAGYRSLQGPGGLVRSSTGQDGDWSAAGTPGFGAAANRAVSALASHRGMLYAGTENAAGGEVWRSSDGNSWSRISEPGFGSAEQIAVGALAVFSDTLYAATVVADEEAGLEVWRCLVCDGADWERVARGGVGAEAPKGPVAFAVARESAELEFLYLAAGSPVRGMEVWRSRAGDEWEVLASEGFGDANNEAPVAGHAVAVYEGRVWVGTLNRAQGGEIWSSAGTRPDGGSGVPGPGPVTPPAEGGRVKYGLVDSWPLAESLPSNALGSIVGMDIGADGTVVLADAFGQRVLVLSPGDSWGTPIGNVGRGPERIGRAGPVELDVARDRVYVADHALHRVLVFDLRGRFVDSWPEVHPMGMDVLADGRLFVADELTGSVRAFAVDGTELLRFGAYGPDDAQNEFYQFGDVAVSDAGVLYVSDQDGDRVRIFRPQGGTYTRLRTLDLLSSRFFRRNQPQCDGHELNLLSETRLLAGPCFIEDGDLVDHAPTTYTGSDIVTVARRSADRDSGRFAVLGTLDTDTDTAFNPVYPSVARLADAGFRVVAGVVPGASLAGLGGTYVNAPLRLSAVPDGTLSLSDGYGLRQMSPDGIAEAELGLASPRGAEAPFVLNRALAVAEGSDDRLAGIATSWRAPTSVVYGTTEDQQNCRDGRCTTARVFQEIWRSTVPRLTTWLAAVAHESTENQFLLLRREAAAPGELGDQVFKLSAYPLGWFGRRTDWDLPGDLESAIWADVEAGADGRIQVLDTLGDRIRALSSKGDVLVDSVRTPKDAWRVASGPGGEAYVLTVYGHVVRIGVGGGEEARFDARPHEGLAPTSLIDMTVDARGHVYVVDEDAREVSAFAPQGPDDTVIEGEQCRVIPSKTADPVDLILGDETEVALSVTGTCGWAEQPSDIVLAVNTFGQRTRMPSQIARQIVALTDLDRHRLGIVAYYAGAQVASPLTDDTSQLIDALRVLDGGRGTESNERAALAEANRLFEDNGRRRVIILIGPEYCSTDERDCPEIADAEELADSIKAEGTHIVVVNGQRTSMFLASSALDDVQVEAEGAGAGRVAHQRIAERLHPTVLIASGVVTDRLPANMELVPGSAAPPAQWDPVARELRWDLSDLGYAPTRFTFRVEPTDLGEWPTNQSAATAFTDGWGNAGSAEFPVPRVRVYAERVPTPTPEPTAEPRPLFLPRLLWTEATPKPPPSPIFLPYLAARDCRPTDKHADVAIAIDTSVSMGSPTEPDGPTKLDAAVAAARTFATLLEFPDDQAALVQFNDSASVVVPLSDSRDEVLAGLDRLSQSSGTRIDRGLQAAFDEVTGPAARTATNRVIVLLSDGEHSGDDLGEVRLVAQAARDAGVLVFTIALGSEADTSLLREIATSSDTFFEAPDTADLATIYERIAYTIPCRR